jgi:hypothetical protein
MKGEKVKEGDFVVIYNNEPAYSFAGSGVLLEIHDIKGTFSRKFYTVYTKGQPILYDDGFYVFESLSKTGQPEKNK